jgi:carbon storage regulator
VLVLTRKQHESIMIGSDIEVVVVAVNGEKVRIGINAPRNVPVFRTDIYLKMQAEHPADHPAQLAEPLDAVTATTTASSAPDQNCDAEHSGATDAPVATGPRPIAGTTPRQASIPARPTQRRTSGEAVPSSVWW